MSGIRVDKGSTWFAAGWAYRHVFTETAKQLISPQDDRLITLVQNSVKGLHWLDLSDWTPDDMRTLFGAIAKAYARMKAVGKDEFHENEFYPGFMARFGELYDLLAKDTRVVGSE